MIDAVREFHEAFDLARRDTPGWVDFDTSVLRVTLIGEEANEVIEAIQELHNYRRDCRALRCEPDQELLIKLLANITKELADLRVVTDGTAVAFGLPLDAAFEAVCYSNMSKLGDDGRPILRADGKVLKGPNYTPAEPAIERIVRAKMHTNCGTEDCCGTCPPS